MLIKNSISEALSAFTLRYFAYTSGNHLRTMVHKYMSSGGNESMNVEFYYSKAQLDTGEHC